MSTDTHELDNQLNEVFSFGYKDPTFIHDIHVLIGGEDKVDAAKATIKALIESAIQEARIMDNHDWDTETFKPITVCRRCATTYQTRGNKPCKGKMAKITLRNASLTNSDTTDQPLSKENK